MEKVKLLSDLEIEQKIREILWGKCVTSVKDEAGIEHSLILRTLNAREDHVVKHIYEKELEKGCNKGLCTEAELKNFHAINGTWDESCEEEIVSLQEGIEKLREVLPEFENRRSKYFSIKNRLRMAEENLKSLTNAKYQLFGNSLEYRANEVKIRQIVFFATETLREAPYWNEQEFDDCLDFTFINNLSLEYCKQFNLLTPIMRQLARSNAWQYRWRSVKNAVDLFGKSAADWSELQNSLIHWSNYYCNLFENPDFPYDLLENDKALDNWVNGQRHQSKIGGTSPRANIISKRPRMQNAKEELFIFVDRRQREEDIARIQSYNDRSARLQLKSEAKTIKEKGKVTEWGLRKHQYLKNFTISN